MEDTHQKVLQSARSIFIQKGFEGARMQEIADHAGINKGLLHYYFKSKQNLFQAVFKEVLRQFIPKLNHILNGEKDIKGKIKEFVHIYIDLLLENPYLPAFVLSEINLKGGLFAREIIVEYQINPMNLLLQIQRESEEGKIAFINPFNLFLNILSLSIFPFIVRPIFKEITGVTDEDYFILMEGRKKEVTDFVLKAINAELT